MGKKAPQDKNTVVNPLAPKKPVKALDIEAGGDSGAAALGKLGGGASKWKVVKKHYDDYKTLAQVVRLCTAKIQHGSNNVIFTVHVSQPLHELWQTIKSELFKLGATPFQGPPPKGPLVRLLQNAMKE